MTSTRGFRQSFNAGEVIDEFFGRIDDAKYAHAVSYSKNCYTLPHGPLVNRPGTYFFAYGAGGGAARLIPFTYDVTQSMVLEFWAGGIRFIRNKALITCSPAAWSSATTYTVGDLVRYSSKNYYCTLSHTNAQPDINADKWTALLDTSGGTGPWIYNIPTPYGYAEVANVQYIQSGDVFTLVHPNHIPKTLSRYNDNKWVLADIPLSPSISAPSGATATATVSSGTFPCNYVVTQLAADGYTESEASAVATCNNNLYTTGNYNTISWTLGTGSGYRVYKLSGGIYGFIGQTDSVTNSIIDDNIRPDTSKTPPRYDSSIFSAGNGPRAVAYFEGRKLFAGAPNDPLRILATRSGTENDMSYSLPTRDDDRISFRLASRDANAIKHLIPLRHLIALTATAVWVVSSTDGPLTPSTIYAPRPHAYVGASDTSPIVVDSTVIFVGGIDNHVYALEYSIQSDGYALTDLSLRAPHLFDGNKIVELVYVRTPYPTIYARQLGGGVLSASYIPGQDVLAWHRFMDFNMGGVTTRSISGLAAVVESGVETIYLAGYLSSSYISTLEYLAPRNTGDIADVHFIDCGIVADGSSGVVTGLDHLFGRYVNVLADGVVLTPKLVGGSGVTLDRPASVVHVGLPIHAEAHTLPITAQIDTAFGQGRRKNVNNVFLAVKNTAGVYVGAYDGKTSARAQWFATTFTTPLPGKLLPMRLELPDAVLTAPALKTGLVQMDLLPEWSDDGRIVVMQPSPLPFMLVALTADVEIGG